MYMSVLIIDKTLLVYMAVFQKSSKLIYWLRNNSCIYACTCFTRVQIIVLSKCTSTNSMHQNVW